MDIEKFSSLYNGLYIPERMKLNSVTIEENRCSPAPLPLVGSVRTPIITAGENSCIPGSSLLCRWCWEYIATGGENMCPPVRTPTAIAYRNKCPLTLSLMCR